MIGQFARKEKEKFTLFSDDDGSFLRRQPGASGQFDTAKLAGMPLVLGGCESRACSATESCSDSQVISDVKCHGCICKL